MQNKLQPNNLIAFIIAFMVCTVVGTLTHELGHIAMAKMLGYKTKLHYASMSWNWEKLTNKIDEYRVKYKTEIIEDMDFPGKRDYENTIKKIRRDDLLIAMGGPLETMLTGVIGLILLFFRRRKIAQSGFKIVDWIAVFLSLFWLREVFNLTMSISKGVLCGSGRYFGGDEAWISNMLYMPSGVVPIVLGVIGLIISVYVVFKVVPKRTRLSFIIGGFIGGGIGFVLWMNFIGPIVLP